MSSYNKSGEKMQTGSAYVVHDPVITTILGPSLAKQSFADECNINVIMAQYRKTGLIEHVNKYQGNYETLPSSMDYHSMLNQAIAAKEAFAGLTAEIRFKFHNDPEEFLAFVEDPDNTEEMIEMGLVKRSMPDVNPPLDVAPEAPPLTPVAEPQPLPATPEPAPTPEP